MRPSEIEATTFYRKNMHWAPVRFYMRSVMDAGSMRQGADMIAAGEIGKEDIVVDVGSGMGGWLSALAKGVPLATPPTGVELSPEMREYSKQRLKEDGLENVRIVAGSALDLDQHIEKATVVNSGWIIKHLTDHEVLTFFKRVLAVLTPGKRFFVCEFGVESGALGRFGHGLAQTKHIRNPADLMSLLDAAGFENIEPNEYAQTWWPMGAISLSADKPL